MGVAEAQHPNLRLDSLQVLRAIAAFAVLVFHLGEGLKIDFGLYEANPFALGANGVDMFFVISGFIICYASMGTVSPIEFLKKRIFRIVPLYYLLTFGVFVIALVAPSLLSSTEANGWHLLKSLVFVPYANSEGLIQPLLFLGWTLNFEMFFYLIFALCMGFKARELMAAIVVVLIAGIGYFVHFGQVVPDFFSRSIILNFAWGIGVFLIYKHWPGVIARIRWLWIPATLVIIAQFFWTAPLAREFSIGIPSAFILASVLNFKDIKGPVGEAGKTVGDASYSLYLVHPYFIQLSVVVTLAVLGVSLLTAILVSIISIITSVIASVALFKLVEKPSNDWLRARFLQPRQSNAEPPVAVAK